MHPLVVIVCLLVPVLVHAGVAQQWSAVTTPAPGVSLIVGSYTAGCIQGAMPLPREGPGFQTMRRARQRFFGHPTLISYVQDLAQRAAQHGLGVLSIGDLGQARGGPAPYGHSSHQIGLDVDIWLRLATPDGRLASQERETLDMVSLLTPDRQALDLSRWSARHARLVQLATEPLEVDRVFVHARIKRALCDTFAGAPWLRKVRPWWGHDSHFHVRLHCPNGATECLGQASLPTGNGCDTLAWWFLPEAQQRQTSATPPAEVQLPAACWDILHR